MSASLSMRMSMPVARTKRPEKTVRSPPPAVLFTV
jgi:hypothetical protein